MKTGKDRAMKKLIVMLALLAVLTLSCDVYRVIQRDPAVLNSTVQLSGEVTGDIVPEIRTLRMHVTGQARNYLLVEIYGMETYSSTQSVAIADSLSYTQVYLSVIDEGPVSNERCYRNVQFWVGPFERDEYYTLHLYEAESAFFRDTLSLSFQYDQSLDTTVRADDCGYTVGDYTLVMNESPCPYYDSQNLPDSLSQYADYAPDSIYIEEQDSSILILSIVTATCGTIFEPYAEVDGDTLKTYAPSGLIPMNACETQYYFFYQMNNYIGQGFFYTFDLNSFRMFKGKYNL